MKKHFITMLILLLVIFGFSGCRSRPVENSDIHEESNSDNIQENPNEEINSTIDSIIQTLDEIDITLESLDNIEESDLVIPLENSDIHEESNSDNIQESLNKEIDSTIDSTIDSIIQTLDEIDITLESLDNIEESDLVIP